jgi:hypothetical protein
MTDRNEDGLEPQPFELLFDIFACVPRKVPLERELKRLDPERLAVSSTDFEGCNSFYRLMCNEIHFMVNVYQTALREAEADPHAPEIATHYLYEAVRLGTREFEEWQKSPQSEFGGRTPREFLEDRGLSKLAYELFGSNDAR